MTQLQKYAQEILDYFGGVSGLAATLGCERQAIYQWRRVPNGRAYEIEVKSGGKFPAEQTKKVCFRMVAKN